MLSRHCCLHLANMLFSPLCALQSPQSGDLKGTGEVTDLQEAFKMLDAENRGYIDAVKLQLICRKLGEDLSVEEVRSLQLTQPLVLLPASPNCSLASPRRLRLARLASLTAPRGPLSCRRTTW